MRTAGCSPKTSRQKSRSFEACGWGEIALCMEVGEAGAEGPPPSGQKPGSCAWEMVDKTSTSTASSAKGGPGPHF